MKLIARGLLAAGLLFGCSSSEPEPSATDIPVADARASADESFYRASADSRRELGVSTWSTPIDNRGGVIKGRDSSRAVILELRRHLTQMGRRCSTSSCRERRRSR